MFGLGNNDDEEKFWNLVTIGFYGTDEELSGVAPFIVIIVGIILVIGALFYFFS